MIMSRKQLLEAVQLLQKFQGEGEGTSQAIYGGRVIVLQILEGILSNIDSISESLASNNESSECFMVLQFSQHCIKSYKEFFITSPHSSGDDTPTLSQVRGTTESREESLSYAFSTWFLSKLIWLLGYRECAALHQRCIDIIAELFVLIRWKDVYFYCKLISEVINSCSDLVTINDNLYEGKSGQALRNFEVNLELLKKSLQDPDKQDEEPKPKVVAPSLDVSSIDMCECLQLNLVKVLLRQADDLNILDEHKRVSVWKCMCCNLEIGDLDLKIESLAVISVLLSKRCLPLREVLDYFISCLVALLDLVCSATKDVDKELMEKLEKEMAAVFIRMIDADRNISHPTHLSQSDLRLILEKVSVTLVTNGFSSLRSQNLKKSLTDLITHIFDCLSSETFHGADFEPLKDSVSVLLLSQAGRETCCEHLIKPLVKLTVVELKSQYSVFPVNGVPDTTDKDREGFRGEKDGGKLPILSQKRKRKAESEDIKRKIKLPRAYHKIKLKLKALVSQVQQSLDQDTLAKCLEGIRGLLTVLMHCVQSCTYPDDSSGQQFHAPEEIKLISLWLPLDSLQRLADTWTIILQNVETMRVKDLNHCVMTIVLSVSCLLDVQDWRDFTPDMLSTFCWILTLPWLQNDPSWIDLKPANAKAVGKISQTISDKLEPDVRCQCIRGMSLFPKEVSPNWRVHVYRQACTDSEIMIKQAAVESFPMLLLHLGPNANHLVRDLVLPLVKDTSCVIQRAVADTAGILACVVCRKAVLKGKNDSLGYLCNSHKIVCMCCDALPDKTSCMSSKDRPKLVDPNMFLPFLSLINVVDFETKINLIKSLKRIFGHINLRTNNTATVNMLNTCLTLIDDSDYKIRVQFSKVIINLVSEGNSDTNQVIVKKLKEALDKSKGDQNIRQQETVLLTIAQLGRVAVEDLLLVVIISLLENMLSPIPLIAAVAYEQLKSVAQFKKTKTQNLFMNSRMKICQFLVDAMHEAQINQGGNAAERILRDVAKVLDFKDYKLFLKVAAKFIIPQLVSKATPAASTLIKLIATMLDRPSRMKLLLEYIKYIYSYLVRICQKGEMERAISFLQNETEVDLGGLLRLHFQQVHQELLLHLSTHYNQVFYGLRFLSAFDENYKGPKDISTAEQMADYLQPRLLGVIAFFDSQLLNANITLTDKKLTMRSLTDILKLMGKRHVGLIRHKVVNTLRIGLQFKDREFMEINCKAWNCFVRSLELSFLGQMMSQIIATLLPLLETLPKQVADIFNYVIVENREPLADHFHDVYFLPDLPELADANAVLKQYTEFGPSSQSDLRSKLNHSMKGISHESLDIRLHALSKLKKLLRDEKNELHEYVIGNETADPIVSQLVSMLLNGCRESDSKAQCLYAECIGELGAIDPGRLELVTNNPKEELAKFQASIDDDNFAIGLINEVVKAFLAAPESRIQDCAAFALQELLKIYKIQEQKESPQHRLWKRFDKHVRQILVPLLSSKYIFGKQETSEQKTPLYCSSEKTRQFQDWVSAWTKHLSVKVKQVKPREVFLACGAVIKHNVDVALYILPYVVVQMLQDGSEKDIEQISREIIEVLNQTRKSDTKHRPGSNSHHLSAQTVFSVLDFLTKWKRIRAQTSVLPLPSSKEPSYMSDPAYKAVNSFLQKIPQDILADACFSCNAYTRALMHFEQFITSKQQNVQDHLDFIQRLYVAMDDPDGVLGVAAIRQTQPTLMEQVLTQESLGQHQDAQACYEKMIQTETDDVSNHQGLLCSLMELGQQTKALLHATGAVAEKPEWGAQLNSYMIEAAWKLGNWQKLETCVKSEKGSKNFAVSIGKILLAAKERKEVAFLEELQIARRDQVGPLSAASMESGSYQRGYLYISRLHMLNEVEKSLRVLLDLGADDSDTPKTSTDELLMHWETRFQIMQCSFRTQEPVLTLRRTLFTLGKQILDLDFDHELGHWWLWSAKIARKAGYLQTAYSALLQASDYHLPEVFLEKAKWLWYKGDKEQALTCLERGKSLHFSDVDKLKHDKSEQAKNKLKVYAQALLLYGKYSEELSNLESNAILKQYREVIDANNEWEDGHFYMAKYYDKIMTTLIEDKDRPDPSKQSDVVIFVVKHFGLSLQFGNQYIYQSMPRLLSLWLDFGSAVVDMEKRDKSRGQQLSQKLQTMRNSLAKLNKIIGPLGEKLAPYQLFTAFPQLVSRICHTQPDVFQQLKEIIARIFVQFPQQSMWWMMAVSKSSYQVRVKRCQEIFATTKQMNPSLNKFIQDATKLTERLLDLCERDFGNIPTLSVTQHFRPLKRLLEDSKFSEILLPLQSAMTVTLPNTPGSHRDHNPFPGNQVYIQSLEDTIEILPSLQRPKKITFIGSDGRFYVMMCKPKDDLRKDCRLMEFNAIVNKFLHKDPESRRRELHIRTYSVIPLNEECGLIEWVNNTHGLRHILLKLYKEQGMYTSGKELKTMMPALQSSLEVKLQAYRDKLLPRHPPVFKDWFLRTFPDPTSWYNARLAYARTAAVMSMVGYILGLGDRHGENILFDSTCGDCVHVDFNCLFNKGETFEWPERVPFRLTHNMVNAMGPLGIEGIFRRACEVTLKVMRNQMDPLMSVLKPFVYDPLVEWSKPAKGQRSNPAEVGEINNDQAMTHVQNIEHRLKGILKSKSSNKPRSVPLSIEGHVNHLLQESTDEKNLSQMYIGWAAYM